MKIVNRVPWCMERFIENMERFVRKWHDGQLREEGRTPYIELSETV